MASSSSSTKPKNSRQKRKSTLSKIEEEPPQKISKHFPNKNSNNIDNYVSSCTIDSIPDDILSKILKMLPMCSWPRLQRTNRQFNRSILLCWRGIREIEFKRSNFHVPFFVTKTGKKYETQIRMMVKSILKMLTSYSPRITSIIGFDSFINYLPKSTLMQVSIFKYLKIVSFSDCEIRREHLAVFLVSVATTLTELDISHCLSKDEDALSLESVILRRNNDTKLIDAIKLLKLKKFYFENNFGLYGLIFDHLDASSIDTLSVANSLLNGEIFSNFLTRCHALTYLDIRKPQFTYKMSEEEFLFDGNLAPSILSSLSSSTHIINNLSTMKMTDVNFPDMEDIKQRCSRGFTDLFTKLINLRELWLYDNEYTFGSIITDRTIYLDRFRDLKILNLDNRGQENVSLSVKLIKSMKKLERLDLHGSSDLAEVDARIIRAVTTSPYLMESLRYLRLNAYFKVDDANAIFKELSSLKNLTGLELIGSHVTDDVLLCWGRAFNERLEILEIVCGSDISDDGFVVSVKHWPNLIRLNLSYSGLSDVSLRVISVSCPKLEEIDLCFCKNVTTAGLQNVVDTCRRLKKIELDGFNLKIDRKVR